MEMVPERGQSIDRKERLSMPFCGYQDGFHIHLNGIKRKTEKFISSALLSQPFPYRWKIKILLIEGNEWSSSESLLLERKYLYKATSKMYPCPISIGINSAGIQNFWITRLPLRRSDKLIIIDVSINWTVSFRTTHLYYSTCWMADNARFIPTGRVNVRFLKFTGSVLLPDTTDCCLISGIINKWHRPHGNVIFSDSCSLYISTDRTAIFSSLLIFLSSFNFAISSPINPNISSVNKFFAQHISMVQAPWILKKWSMHKSWNLFSSKDGSSA